MIVRCYAHAREEQNFEERQIAAHRMVRLMDRDDNRLDIVALIATLLLSLCLWPMIWELTRAILQYL